MGENSKIEWTHHSFNPWVGCTKVSAACDFCYAEGWAKRTGQAGLWAGERRRTSAANWRQPLKWNAAAKAAGVRQRVFCASLADVFDNQVPEGWRADLFGLIRDTPSLDWLLLTKRPQNITKMLYAAIGSRDLRSWNVWLGTTIESAEHWYRYDEIAEVPAWVRFISYEPALGPLNLAKHITDARPSPDWVIAGGESGGKARAANPDWFRDLRDECAALGVSFLFKQWGEYAPLDPLGMFPDMTRLGKKRAGRLLDGVEHNGYPA